MGHKHSWFFFTKHRNHMSNTVFCIRLLTSPTLPVEEILQWTRTHLEAYLATAQIFLDQNVEPG